MGFCIRVKLREWRSEGFSVCLFVFLSFNNKAHSFKISFEKCQFKISHMKRNKAGMNTAQVTVMIVSQLIYPAAFHHQW